MHPSIGAERSRRSKAEKAITVVNIFKKLVAEEGVTIVMTTHDVGLMDAGDTVYTIEDGRVANCVVNKEL